MHFCRYFCNSCKTDATFSSKFSFCSVRTGILHTVARCKGVNLVLGALLAAIRKLGHPFSSINQTWSNSSSHQRFVILKCVSKLAVSLPGRLKLNTAYPCIRNVALVHLGSFGRTIKTEERACLDREISTQKLWSEFQVHRVFSRFPPSGEAEG